MIQQQLYLFPRKNDDILITKAAEMMGYFRIQIRNKRITVSFEHTFVFKK